MQHDESELRDSFASTLPKVIQSGGQNMSQAAREAVVSFLEELYGTPNLKGESFLDMV